MKTGILALEKRRFRADSDPRLQTLKHELQALGRIDEATVSKNVSKAADTARTPAEDPHQLEVREAASGFLSAGLGISTLIFGSVRQAGAGAVNDLDAKATPKFPGSLSVGGDGATQAR